MRERSVWRGFEGSVGLAAVGVALAAVELYVAGAYGFVKSVSLIWGPLLLLPVFFIGCAVWCASCRSRVNLHGDTSRVWLLSFIFASLYFAAWPTDSFFDDGAISLRYFEMFAEGHWFRYNTDGPPVFGLSGFIHGLFAGLMAYSGGISAENSAQLSNFFGLVLVSACTYFIMLRVARRHDTAFLLWAVCLLASPPFLLNIRQNMECPLHVGIALAALLLYMKRSGWMWPVFALAVISKLDAGALAALLCIAAVFRDPRHMRPLSLKNPRFRGMTIGFFGPLALYALYTTWLFGSPIPNSMSAKLVVFKDYQSGPFAFLEGLPDPSLQWVCLSLWLGACAYKLFRPAQAERLLLVPGMVALAIYASFLIFDSAEHMPWYYALPDYLFKLQALIILHAMTRGFWTRRNHLKLALSFASFAVLVLPSNFEYVDRSIEYFATAQRQWEDAGRWVRENADEGATFMSGLGFPALASDRHFIDFVGLNSKDVLKSRKALDLIPNRSPAIGRYNARQTRLALLNEFEPDYLYISQFGTERCEISGTYDFVTAHYNHQKYGGVVFRLYERVAGEVDACLFDWEFGAADVTSDSGSVHETRSLSCEGKELRLRAGESGYYAERFASGVALLNYEIEVEAALIGIDGDRILETSVVLPKRDESRVDRITFCWQIPLPEGTRIKALEFTAKNVANGTPETLRLLAPMLINVRHEETEYAPTTAALRR